MRLYLRRVLLRGIKWVQMSSKSKLQIGVLLTSLGMSLVVGQACGSFSAATGVGSQFESNANSDLVADASGVATGQTVTYRAPNVPASASSANYSWTSSFVNNQGGASAACIELNGNSHATYSIVCSSAGTLNLEFRAVVDGISYGPFSMSQPILDSLASVPTPTPVPGSTPVPAPTPNPAGVSLFSSKCSSCHGSLTGSNIVNKTASGISGALQSVGQMRGINLTATQVQQISDALNGH
jgi:hypothetical protein